MPSERLLIVDDDAANRVTLGALLDAEGWEVDEAGGYDEALVRLGATTYALVILDWRLDPHVGADLVAPIRAMQPRARILILTGSTHGLDPAQLGVDAIAMKGESFDALVTKLRAL